MLDGRRTGAPPVEIDDLGAARQDDKPVAAPRRLGCETPQEGAQALILQLTSQARVRPMLQRLASVENQQHAACSERLGDRLAFSERSVRGDGEVQFPDRPVEKTIGRDCALL